MKIDLGSSKLKKSFFPNDFDSSTTLNFGEVVPLFCKPVVAESNVDIDIRSAVRFAPLSLPTFGKAYLKNYTFYNRFDQLYPPYNNLLTQTPYTGTGFPYVPSKVPSVPLSFLWSCVLVNSRFTIYDIGPGSLPALPTTVYGQVPIRAERFTGSIGSLTGSELASILPATLLMCSSLDFPNYTYSSESDPISLLVADNEIGDVLSGQSATDASYYVSSVYSPDSTIQPVEPSSSDYMFVASAQDIFYYPQDNIPTNVPLSNGAFVAGHNYLFCLRLNDSGKLLRKIFKGLGYQIVSSNEEVSILPLCAFWKNYFDTFYPKRFMQYTQTNLYRLINDVVQKDSTVIGELFERLASNTSPILVYDIINDLVNCFYTQDTNYYTVQIIGQINNFGNSLSQQYLETFRGSGNPPFSPSSTSVQSIFSSTSSGLNAAVDLRGGTIAPIPMHSQVQQNILSRLTEFLNVRSLVGGKIADTLESVYGIKKKEVLDEMGYVGSSSIDVEISDVFATTESSDVTLGEYAGKALSYGNNGHYKIDCPVNGVIITFATIVPRTQYVDGVEPYLFNVDYASQYNPKFDGLTLLPSKQLSFYGQDVLTSPSRNRSFGNIPIYSEYKTKTQGVLNGDLSLKSTQNSYDSFTMDNVISDEPVIQTDLANNSGFQVTYRTVVPQYLSTSINWRFLGRWLWNGRFDRIFVNTRGWTSDNLIDVDDATMSLTRNTGRTDDNMVCHNVVDMKINAPMLPLADSFMTKDLYELENGVGVRSQGE